MSEETKVTSQVRYVVRAVGPVEVGKNSIGLPMQLQEGWCSPEYESSPSFFGGSWHRFGGVTIPAGNLRVERIERITTVTTRTEERREQVKA